jgi:hypothetical protein
MRVLGRRGKMTFTVTNRGPADDVGVVAVLPGPGVAKSWFTVDSAQRPIKNGASAAFVVNLALPPRAKSGHYTFEGIVYSHAASPEATARSSGRVAFTCRTRTRNMLWLVIAIIALWTVAGAAILYVYTQG